MDPAPNPDQQSSSPKQQVTERLRQAVNVLVTVRTNPNVDELASAIGLTLMLNKLGKHATAVFSGEVPSTLEFLKPEETIETNTDSLRDFIVSLDKSKADKLRYKVEENVVKIFITPYRTSITEKDLEFTQGDFNVDVVVALGVTQREELDQAITAHGRILHDATIITVTCGQRESSLGVINWQEPAASSLSEMLVSISESFQGGLIDTQMATAFLTGIVAETERFSNPKTSPKVMTMAAQLMAAGANQQLIANELEKTGEVAIHAESETAPAPDAPASHVAEAEEGTLSVQHDAAATADKDEAPDQTKTAPEPVAEPAPSGSGPEIQIDNEGNLMRPKPTIAGHKVIQPLGSQTEQTSAPSFLPPAPKAGADDSGEIFNPLQAPGAQNSSTIPGLPPMPEIPPDSAPAELPDDTTLAEIEEAVRSPHVQADDGADPQESARAAVDSAFSQTGFDPANQARSDLNSLPLTAPAEPAPAPEPAPQQTLPPVQNPEPAASQPLPAQEPIPVGDNLVAQVPGGMPLHTLGEVVPEGDQGGAMAPPPVPPPFNLPQ